MCDCTCPYCGTELRIEENDYMPGCREMEEVICPICHKEVTKVFTSGIPQAYKDEWSYYGAVMTLMANIFGNILATENQQARINNVIDVKTVVYLHKT